MTEVTIASGGLNKGKPPQSTDQGVGGVNPIYFERSLVTPDTAVERIKKALQPFFPNPVETKRLLESANAPKRYVDSSGVERGYSFPKEFSLVLIDPPEYRVTADRTRMFSLCLGLRRTEHDPKSGTVNQFWTHPTGPIAIGYTAGLGEVKDAVRYPISYPAYSGNEPTCWARFHLIFASGLTPFFGLSALQNERLIMDSMTEGEFAELFRKSTRDWKKHYIQVKRKIAESGENVNLFAYPNRSLLLPLVGLKIAEDLGVEAFAVAGRSDAGIPIYAQTMRFLRGCSTDVKIAFITDLNTKEVVKEFKFQCNLDLSVVK